MSDKSLPKQKSQIFSVMFLSRGLIFLAFMFSAVIDLGFDLALPLVTSVTLGKLLHSVS